MINITQKISRIYSALKRGLVFLKNGFFYFLIFSLSLLYYLLVKFFLYLFKLPLMPKNIRLKLRDSFERKSSRLSRIFGLEKPGTISRIQLIELSLRNLKIKKNRTFITIGGMAIGIAAIVFLVSIGYGLQSMVVSRVARLDEMKQADMTAQAGTGLKVNDEIISKTKDISNVEDVLPVISVVGRVNFNSSVSDVAVYGVTSDYLKNSAIKTYKGSIFNSNELTVKAEDEKADKGAQSAGESLGNPQNKLVGDASGQAESRASLNFTDVPGSNGEFVELNDKSSAVQKNDIETRAISSQAKRQAVVNAAMLSVLGLPDTEAINKQINISFISTSDEVDGGKKVRSQETPYEIVGIVNYGDTPLMYVPFLDLRTLGITNYSQARVVVKEEDDLADARKKIEAMGYNTTSVADTVQQVNSFFANVRKISALVGAIALAVASLGMFNTLTVSLLERTREVGLMKAMGMKSDEIRDLFLTESMIISFFGGLFGLLLGYLGGKLLSLLLTFFSLTKGQGYMDVSQIPFIMVVYVLMLSLSVGIITGIYPARRAKKISALNALRYE